MKAERAEIAHEELAPTLLVDKQRLETIMHRRGYTNVKLAKEIGMHQNSIASLKNVGTTRMDTLAAICEALECHPFDLLVAEGFPEPFLARPESL